MNKKTAYGVLLAYKNLRDSTGVSKEEEIDLTITGKLVSLTNIYRAILKQKPETRPTASTDLLLDHSFTVEPVYTVIEDDRREGERYLEQPDLERFGAAFVAYLKASDCEAIDLMQGANGVRVFCRAADAQRLESLMTAFHEEQGGFMSEAVEDYVADTLKIRPYKLPEPLVKGLIAEKDALSIYRSYQPQLQNEL
jgi:hypothetical protein